MIFVELRTLLILPVIVKGVECAEDAMLAIGAGADGIIRFPSSAEA